MMKMKLCKVYTLECQQGGEICFRYNKIRYFDTLERQTMGVIRVNKYASIAPDKAAYCLFTQLLGPKNAIKLISMRTKTQ